MEIRTLTPADIDAAADLTARVFGTADQYDQYFALAKAANLSCPFTPPDLCYAMFEAGRLVAKLQLADLRVRVLGVPVRAVGVMTVAAEPTHRRLRALQGLTGAARGRTIAEGFDLAVGVARRGAAYMRLGGAPICSEPRWEVDPFRVPEPTNRALRIASDADAPFIVDAYNRDNAARSGSLVRSLELYAFLPRRASEVWIGERGYVALRMHSDALEVREAAVSSDAFADTALREVARLARERGVRRVFGEIPLDHALVRASAPFGPALSEGHSRASGCMASVIAPQRLLERLAPELTRRLQGWSFAGARVTIALDVDGEPCRVVLNEQDASTRDVSLKAAVTGGELAQWLFGYPAANERFATACDEPTLPAALTAQPAPFMWCTDRF